MANNVINMSEQDILSDCLNSQKHITNNYNMFAGECSNTNLRDDFLNILKEEHLIQSDIFTEMQSHGWYETKPASQQEVEALKTKFPC